MKPVSRPAANKLAQSIDVVPKCDLEQALQENKHLRKENDRLRRETEQLKQETERLRQELEAALRASKRQAAPHSRGNPKSEPEAPWPQTGPPLWPTGVPSH